MASSYSSSPQSSSPSGESFGASEWTQRNMMSDLVEQKGLLIGLGAAVLTFLLLRARSSRPEEKAARRLVRDWRKVDDPEDARDLLGSNLPTILRPALLIALEEIERQVHSAFRKAERQIHHL